MKFQIKDKVRRPIGIKIFGITAVLLFLMTLVTYSSTSYLKRVNYQLTILSEYYIPLDQAMGEVKSHHLAQILFFERLASLPAQPGFETTHATVRKFTTDMGSCEREKFGAAAGKVEKALAAAGEQEIAIYEMVRFCAGKKIEAAQILVDKALRMPSVKTNLDQVQKFTRLHTELKSIPDDRAALHATAIKYLLEVQRKDAHSIEILRDQFEANGRNVSRQADSVARLLESYTQEAASKASALEKGAFAFNWGMTAAAAILGLVFAVLLTRNLVRPVRELLSGAKAVGQGDLNVQVRVNSADEIALLAHSFNHMVAGLKESKTIKDTFGKYVDPRIVSALLQKQPLSEDGEKKLMTIFFSDIEGFTSICEQLTPDVVVRFLNHYLSVMSEPILGNHGVIDKYIGDAIMAFWGPPFTEEKEHALLACHSALEQLERLENFRKTLPDIIGLRKGLPTFHVRIGISTGNVTVGTIGSAVTKSYTVVGDTVNLASRLEAANKHFGTSVMISENTWLMAREAVEARELDCIRVVGKTEPIRVYELLGRKGQVDPIALRLRDSFEQGLKSYRNCDWTAATECFENCLQINQADTPSQRFLSRIRHFEMQMQPPAKDWDGVWNFSEK